jgi:hypothetical protein
MSSQCFVCGEKNKHVLQEHHIVPRRHGGGESKENLVTLCANCHAAIEKIYTDDRWKVAFKNYRQSHDGPFVSDLSDREVCPECLRRWNPENGTVEIAEPESPLYD